MLALLAAAPASAHAPDPLERYAQTTWASFVAMTDAQSGLPADALNADGSTSVQTSTTNIGAYMWSALVAERLGISRHRETVDRLDRTLTTLERMERHDPSGQFYNWYDHRTGAKLTSWPPTGEPLTPILSSVDNGWLAVGLRVVASRVPELRGRAQALFDSMDFGFYYRPDVNRVLFHYVPDTGAAPCCYDTIVSESRIASYIGIEKGGYAGYGVDAIGMDPNGMPSNEDGTLVDHGYPACGRPAQPDPPASAYTNGVVTPHAAFLALRWAPREAVENLRRLERDFPGMYGKWGFRDTVNVDTGSPPAPTSHSTRA